MQAFSSGARELESRLVVAATLNFQNLRELGKKLQEMVYHTRNCTFFNNILSMIFNRFIDRLTGDGNFDEGAFIKEVSIYLHMGQSLNSHNQEK